MTVQCCILHPANESGCPLCTAALDGLLSWEGPNMCVICLRTRHEYPSHTASHVDILSDTAHGYNRLHCKLHPRYHYSFVRSQRLQSTCGSGLDIHTTQPLCPKPSNKDRNHAGIPGTPEQNTTEHTHFQQSALRICLNSESCSVFLERQQFLLGKALSTCYN